MTCIGAYPTISLQRDAAAEQRIAAVCDDLHIAGVVKGDTAGSAGADAPTVGANIQLCGAGDRDIAAMGINTGESDRHITILVLAVSVSKIRIADIALLSLCADVNVSAVRINIRVLIGFAVGIIAAVVFALRVAQCRRTEAVEHQSIGFRLVPPAVA